LPLRKCTKEDFDNFFYPFKKKAESYKEMLTWYCIEQSDFQIQGNWDSKTGSLVKLSLTSCNQSKLQPGKKCKPVNEALDRLTDNGRWRRKW